MHFSERKIFLGGTFGLRQMGKYDSLLVWRQAITQTFTFTTYFSCKKLTSLCLSWLKKNFAIGIFEIMQIFSLQIYYHHSKISTTIFLCKNHNAVVQKKNAFFKKTKMKSGQYLFNAIILLHSLKFFSISGIMLDLDNMTVINVKYILHASFKCHQ